mmetsp:Transcript_89519/g.175213  ORF Transcript_89519/g.175213 Transcript_89519/m.175213 type:complete len:99 (+) Transcript_89519:850-1146(+)
MSSLWRTAVSNPVNSSRQYFTIRRYNNELYRPHKMWQVSTVVYHCRTVLDYALYCLELCRIGWSTILRSLTWPIHVLNNCSQASTSHQHSAFLLFTLL